MHIMDNKPMTPEMKDELKTQVIEAVEGAFAGEAATKGDILKAVSDAVAGLNEAPGMGGLGEEADKGMKLPESEGDVDEE